MGVRTHGQLGYVRHQAGLQGQPINSPHVVSTANISANKSPAFLLGQQQLPQGSLEDHELSFDSYSVSRVDESEDSPPNIMDFRAGSLSKVDGSGDVPSSLLFPTKAKTATEKEDMIYEDETVGELRLPSIRSDALASPLGSVPSLTDEQSRENKLHSDLFSSHLGQVSHASFGFVPEAFGVGLADAGDGDLTLGKGNLSTLDPRKRDEDWEADGRSDGGLALGAEALDGDFMSGCLNEEAAEKPGDVGLSSELTSALQQLTPEEVERRRQRMSSTYRLDMNHSCQMIHILVF